VTLEANDSRARLRRLLRLLALITAGETIFLLPFVLARIFRPTMLEVFGLTKLQLGTAFSLYGIGGWSRSRDSEFDGN